MNCPNCKSEHTQTFRMVYESGTSAGIHHSVGVGLASGGGLGIGTAQTLSTTTTNLAARVAPPEEKTFGWLHVGAFVVGGGIVMNSRYFTEAIPGLVLVAGAVAWAIWKRRWNKSTYPKIQAQWERSWLCHRCGHHFTVE